MDCPSYAKALSPDLLAVCLGKFLILDLCFPTNKFHVTFFSKKRSTLIFFFFKIDSTGTHMRQVIGGRSHTFHRDVAHLLSAQFTG